MIQFYIVAMAKRMTTS